ncbi:MAG: cyclic 2,3-diphosphoglycerate synthase [Proteobacteria bacterium]|nr:cyclic 2,3-diphosphoglycerate synthase [Pseudomonadota bacterium]
MLEKVIIMGAAGRDFHNFNVYFRDNERYKVVAFTATQIPDIDGRCYPSELCGEAYPAGIPIVADDKLAELIEEHEVDLVVFSYSDITHTEVMHKASIATAKGADFMIVGAQYTMIESYKPVVSVCAVRTGCGKSQTSRQVMRILQKTGKKVVAVRHPMPYGDLTKQVVQRFATMEDMDTYQCTIEEREEYEPVVRMGAVIFAGVDYGLILQQAEQEADVVVWDGGNNDTPFYKPTVNIVVFDPHRAGHELTYHPGETNMRMCDVAIINKVDSADPAKVEQVRRTIETCNPKAEIILADSEVTADQPELIRGKRALVIEDGPTLTHGEMQFGAGTIAAQQCGASALVDPRPFLVGTLKRTFEKYPDIGTLLPAMGYSDQQVRDLEATINATDCEVVVSGTPIDITRLMQINKPVVRVTYDYKDHADGPTLENTLLRLLQAAN